MIQKKGHNKNYKSISVHGRVRWGYISNKEDKEINAFK